jgi:hypothetical protein
MSASASFRRRSFGSPGPFLRLVAYDGKNDLKTKKKKRKKKNKQKTKLTPTTKQGYTSHIFFDHSDFKPHIFISSIICSPLQTKKNTLVTKKQNKERKKNVCIKGDLHQIS